MNRSVAALGLVGVGAAMGLLLAFASPKPSSNSQLSIQRSIAQSIEWLDNPRPVNRFRLETTTHPFTDQSLRGRWTIVVFGFLNCPDICPTSLADLAHLADALALEERAPKPAEPFSFVFVSVDPDRDTVAEVEAYAQYFHASIDGATGAQAQLKRFAKDLGVQFKVTKPLTAQEGTDKANDYQVAHSITFSIIDPSGNFRARFRPGFNVDHLTANLANHLSNHLSNQLDSTAG